MKEYVRLKPPAIDFAPDAQIPVQTNNTYEKTKQ
jgi:hypothetical protein